MAEIKLPQIAALPSADDDTIIATLDLLFEPSPEIHRLAIPVVRGQDQPQTPVSSRIPANPGLSADLGNKSQPFGQATNPIKTNNPTGTPFKAATVPAPSSSTSSPYKSYPELINRIGALMLDLVDTSATEPDSSSSSGQGRATPDSRARLHSILGSHPRLGAKKVDSALSRAEQAQLNNNANSSTPQETEAQALSRLNAEYEDRFPGLRYVVFVNGRERDVIMRDMRRRIDRGDIRLEEREGVTAMIDIALDRAGKILGAAAAGT